MDLFDAIRDSWARDTSADNWNWTENNPAYGQCAVTALVVQYYRGGDLLRTTVDGVSHYFNQLPDGDEVDLTWCQFPEGSVKGAIEKRNREYVLSFPDTLGRYWTLLDRVSNRLHKRGRYETT